MYARPIVRSWLYHEPIGVMSQDWRREILCSMLASGSKPGRLRRSTASPPQKGVPMAQIASKLGVVLISKAGCVER